jgi:CBS domain-containing protein
MEALELILESKGRTMHVIAPDASVLDAVEAMCRARVGALLVMDGDEIAGIFSERDLMKRVVLAQREPADTPVGDVMTREIVCVEHDASPKQAMALVTDHRVRHLPVLQGRRIIGIISIGDLVRWTIRDRERVIEDLEQYVAGRYPG